MEDATEKKESRLVPILREGVAVIQMILFKELKGVVARKHPALGGSDQTMLAGAIINELFDSHNREEKFQLFYVKHKGIIEQELLSLREEVPQLMTPLTDALRVQTLYDNQEGTDSGDLLKLADRLGILPPDRELPLPSTFMESVRKLGSEHNLIIPPVEIDATEENDMLQ